MTNGTQHPGVKVEHCAMDVRVVRHRTRVLGRLLRFRLEPRAPGCALIRRSSARPRTPIASVGEVGVEVMSLAFQTFEPLQAPVLECESRRLRERARRLRDEDLTRGGLCHDPGGLVNGDAANVPTRKLHLADMHARAHAKPVAGGGVPDRLGRAERVGRTVECRQDPVSRRVDLASAEPIERRAGGSEVAGEELAPGPVTELRRGRRGVDEVGEEQRGERPSPVVNAGPTNVCRPAHSSMTAGSSPITQPSCPGGMSTTSSGAIS